MGNEWLIAGGITIVVLAAAFLYCKSNPDVCAGILTDDTVGLTEGWEEASIV